MAVPAAATREVRREVVVRNRLGMHARAAVKFVQIASRFAADVRVEKDGQQVNGKSIMGLLTLVAAYGMSMTIVAIGKDARAALDALTRLVASGFDEGIDEAP